MKIPLSACLVVLGCLAPAARAAEPASVTVSYRVALETAAFLGEGLPKRVFAGGKVHVWSLRNRFLIDYNLHRSAAEKELAAFDADPDGYALRKRAKLLSEKVDGDWVDAKWGTVEKARVMLADEVGYWDDAKAKVDAAPLVRVSVVFDSIPQNGQVFLKVLHLDLPETFSYPYAALDGTDLEGLRALQDFVQNQGQAKVDSSGRMALVAARRDRGDFELVKAVSGGSLQEGVNSVVNGILGRHSKPTLDRNGRCVPSYNPQGLDLDCNPGPQ